MSEETPTEECLNCGTKYTIKKGMPAICWVCGMPTDEKIEEIMNDNTLR